MPSSQKVAIDARFLVLIGVSIADRIGELTGIDSHTVRSYLDEKYKREGGRMDVTSTRTEPVRVPEHVAAS